MIEVALSIDQGEDSPVQRGVSRFYMIASDRGWQVLPGPAEETPGAVSCA